MNLKAMAVFAALLLSPCAMAYADDGIPPYVPDPSSPEMITAHGSTLYDTRVFGDQLYDVHDSSGNTIGTFETYEFLLKDIFGYTDSAYKVTDDVTGVANDPGVGSIVDVFSGNGYENVYTDINGMASDLFQTPFGDYNIPPGIAVLFLPDLQGLNPGYTGLPAAADFLMPAATDLLTPAAALADPATSLLPDLFTGL